LDGQDRYRILLFGQPGSGKTPFAAQAPAPIFLMADRGGAASLAITGTPYIEIPSEKAANEALDYLALQAQRPSFPYQTVVVDTFSVLSAHVANGIMRRDGMTSMDGFKAWGDLKASMSTILDKLQRLPLHVIVNVHLKDKFDSQEYEPDLIGGTKIDLPKEFPFIGWIHTDWGIGVDDNASDAEKAKAQASRKVVRKISWRASPKFPILRSPAGLLDETSVEFKSSDFTQITDALAGQAAKYGQATVVTEQTPADQVAADVAGPDIKGGAVEPDATKVPRKAAKKAAVKKEDPKAAIAAQVAAEDAITAVAAEPVVSEGELAHYEAIALTTEELGGVVASDEIDYLERIKAITAIDGPEGLKDFYIAHKDKADWHDEHTGAVTARKKALS
jgi:hypothetical protein